MNIDMIWVSKDLNNDDFLNSSDLKGMLKDFKSESGKKVDLSITPKTKVVGRDKIEKVMGKIVNGVSWKKISTPPDGLIRVKQLNGDDHILGMELKSKNNIGEVNE